MVVGERQKPETQALVKRVWTEPEILRFIMKDDFGLKRGILAIYKKQTEDEKASDTTKHYNNVGFGGVDATFGSSLAKQIIRNNQFQFSPKQRAAAQKMMQKYVGQLTKIANKKI